MLPRINNKQYRDEAAPAPQKPQLPSLAQTMSANTTSRMTPPSGQRPVQNMAPSNGQWGGKPRYMTPEAGAYQASAYSTMPLPSLKEKEKPQPYPNQPKPIAQNNYTRPVMPPVFTMPQRPQPQPYSSVAAQHFGIGAPQQPMPLMPQQQMQEQQYNTALMQAQQNFYNQMGNFRNQLPPVFGPPQYTQPVLPGVI